MNIFDLPGPEFLGVFAVIAIAAIALAYGILYRLDNANEPALPRDPYVIAWLRGGARETLRVAVLSLLDRGLLVVNGNQIGWRTAGESPAVRHDIERRVVAACAKPCEVSQVIDTNHGSVEWRMKERLREEGLLPGPTTPNARQLIFVVVSGGLWWLAGCKLVLASERGRSNVLGLWTLAILATVAAAIVAFGTRRRARTERALAIAKELYRGLPTRASSMQTGKDPVEVLQLAAVFGVPAVPLAVFPQRELLGAETRVRRHKHDDTTTGGSGCSACGSSSGASSCGSGGSCGSSCGSGCGGCGS